MIKKNSKIDVAVLITFFARPKTLKKVFESVREARPSTLLLWQDGPRKNHPQDIENIKLCRDIVDNIDWKCNVYKNFHNENMGCDPSTYLAQKWAFSIVDKCIIMEDDRVPSQSFYLYCKELLDKYEFDERINIICGTNLLGVYDECPNDYFFSPNGSTTWASWRRVVKDWDETYSYLKDDYAMSCLKKNIGHDFYNTVITNAKKHSQTGYQWWETILGLGGMLHNRLAIIPKKNLITDLGLTDNSTHATAKAKLLPKIYRRMFNMKSFEINFPIKHPKYVMPDYNYVERIFLINGIGHPWLLLYRKLEYLLRCIYYGETINILKKKLSRRK